MPSARWEQYLGANVEIDSVTGCWEWTARRDKDGYGDVYIDRHRFRAHRLSLVVWGTPAAPGEVVCHSCDNPPCINPDHLRPGTSADNASDRKARGRYGLNSGEKNGSASVTRAQVDEMRRRLLTEETTCADLAREFGVKSSAAHNILRGKTWPVDDPELHVALNEAMDAAAKRRKTTPRKLSLAQMAQMSTDHAAGVPMQALMSKYGLSDGGVRLYLKRAMAELSDLSVETAAA